MRLCIPVHKAGVCNNCGRMANASGYHAFICGGLFNFRHVRHEIVSEGVVQILRSGGFNPVKNAKVCCLGSNNADILSDGDRIGM
jgi:homoaconitase/3-isopropylmalate dehydratase large subunit